MQKSFFKHLIEQYRDELISKIADAADGVYSPGLKKEGDKKEKRVMLHSELIDIFNNVFDKESTTETREVTILLSDLRGFTAMSENFPAASVIELLNRYFAKMSKIIVTHHGGTIDKFMGDAIMVLFGAPESRKDDLKRALACAVDMQLAMDEINSENKKLGLPDLFMGIGINTGKVVAGKLGSELHSEYTVIGDEVNLAARVEAYSLRGQILVSSNVYELANNFIKTNDPVEVFVKGKKEPVTLYELLEVNEPELRSVPRREVRNSPRVEVNMPFTYQCISCKTVVPEKLSGTIIDISYNGIFAALDKEIAAFSDIKFTLNISMLGEHSSDIYAKVLKVFEKDGKYNASIEFTSIQPEAKAAVKSFMERIIQGG